MFKQSMAMAGEETERALSCTDKWGGKNHGCYPVHTPGQQLKERLDRSDQWKMIERNDRVDERNDNQIDIHRGSDFEYLHADGKKRIYVIMNKSRSGKTIDWTFRLNFDGPIDF